MYKINAKDWAIPRSSIHQFLLVMRITTFLLVLSLLQVSASTLAQKVSLSANNMALTDVFKEIYAQTEHDFIFTTSTLRDAKSVTLDLKDVELDEALRQIFADQPLAYSFSEKSVVVTKKERVKSPNQPTRGSMEPSAPLLILAYEIVSGRIVDSLGQALVGASVRVLNADGKRTALQTKTNHEGYFELRNVPEESMLEVTYVGYVRREVKTVAALGSIVLKAVPSELAEVVVSTGYQTLPKERATGSFSHIDNELFNQQVGPTIMERLEAIGNGILVDPVHSEAPNIMVRGLSTIQGPKQVLVIVDNFPYEGDINNINPNDVEDITILKDAAAASIWGARAGNGVIVIRTKSGNYNQPIRMAINSNLTIGQKPDLYKVPQVSSAGFVEFEELLYEQGYFDSRLNANPSWQIVSPVVELLVKRDKATSGEERTAIEAQIANYKTMDVRDDMMDYLYRNSLNQQYALNVSGGMERFAWSASTNFDHNVDELQARYRRFNARFRQVYKPFRNLELSTDIYYTQSNSMNGALGYGSMKQNLNGFYVYTDIADDQGNPLGVLKENRQAWTDTVLAGKLLDWDYYPLTDWKHETREANLRDMIFNAGLNYKVFDGLALDVKYQYENQYVKTDRLYGVESHDMRVRINMHTSVNPDGSVRYNYPYGARYLYNHAILNSHQLRGQVNLDKRWADHELVAIGGGEIRMAVNEATGGGLYGYDPELLTFQTITTIPRPIRTIRGTNANLGDLTEQPQYRSTRFVSFFVNAAYTWRGKYTISSSGRTDASNLFGLNTNDQWNPFLSLGLSWNISKENFYSLDALPYLKLRGTYGVSGNIDPAMVASTTILYGANSALTNNQFNGQRLAGFQNYYNPELRWETAKQVNIGLDFASKGQVVHGSVEYFHKMGDNLFGRAMLDYTGGAGRTITKNVSKMKGSGFDLELNVRILDQTFKWNTRLNYSIYKDELVDYYQQLTAASSYVSRQGKAVIPGYPISSIFTYRWAGLDPETGDPRSYQNGQVSKNYREMITAPSFDDLVYHGSSIPTHYGNFLNRFGYKNIELNIALSYKLGYFFNRETVSISSLSSMGIGHSDFDKRWQKPGDEQFTDVPSLTYPYDSYRESIYSGSDVLVERGDHIRIQYLQLSYQLRKAQIPRLPFQGVRIYANVNNPGLLWRANRHGIDPDFIYGYERNGVPGITSYSMGLQLNFN